MKSGGVLVQLVVDDQTINKSSNLEDPNEHTS